MRLPPETTAFWNMVVFGQFAKRGLRRRGFGEQADAVQQATDQVKVAGRAWQDSLLPIQDAYADREGADAVLDNGANEGRRILISRSAEAATTAPYTTIYHSGPGYYTNAPVAEEIARYQEMVQRLMEALRPDDALVLNLVPRINEGITAYQAAATALQQVRVASALARAALDAAVDDWRRQMERTYGFLIGEIGKKEAEKIFPRTKAEEPNQGDSTADGQ